MAIKTARFKIKGMNQDLAVSSFSPEFAYENYNLRITANETNTLLSLTNEKGNVQLQPEKPDNYIQGRALGYAVISDKIVLFTHNDNVNDTTPDRIYRIDQVLQYQYRGIMLYEGNLNFDMTRPIETLAWYENEDIQKVYWVDGLNKPRMINIMSSYYIIDNPETQFDFNRTLQLKEEIEIDVNNQGQFHSGVIQYFITYYNRNGAESNIAWQSPLFYISHKDRGASPDEMVSISFELKILHDTIDNNFEYARLYAVQRTTRNGEVLIRRVTDLSVDYVNDYYTDTGNEFVFIDSGSLGESVDATYLYYVGGADIIAGCISQKDQTLFLGDITLRRKLLGNVEGNILWNGKILPASNDASEVQGKYYHYNNLMGDQGHTHTTHNQNNYEGAGSVSTFKYLEEYRFGVQFQYENGEWSEVKWIGDSVNTYKPSDYGFANPAVSKPQIDLIKANLPEPSIGKIVKVRPVVVYPKEYERNVVCQGILCPTVYNVGDRVYGRTFSYSSWFSRPMAPRTLNLEYDGNGNTLYPGEVSFPTGINGYTEALYPYNPYAVRTSDFYKKGCWAEFRHNYGMPSPSRFNGEIQTQYTTKGGMAYPLIPYLWEEGTTLSTPQDFADKWQDGFNIDQSIFTMHSPDIEFDSNFSNLAIDNLKLRIIGFVPLDSNSGDIDITAGSTGNYKTYAWNLSGFVTQYTHDEEDHTRPSGFYKEKVGETILSSSRAGWFSLINGPYWQDKLYNPSFHDNPDWPGSSTEYTYYPTAEYIRFGYIVYPWQRTGSLANDKSEQPYSKLENKIISNLKYSLKTSYFAKMQNGKGEVYEIGDGYWTSDTYYNGDKSNGLADIKFIDDTHKFAVMNNPFGNNQRQITYSGDMDKLLSPVSYDWPSILSVFATCSSNYHFLKPDYQNSPEGLYQDVSLGNGLPNNYFFNNSDYFGTLFNFSNYFRQDGRHPYYYATIPNSYRVAYGMYNGTQYNISMHYNIDDYSPISMRYKSSPHVVMSLDSVKDLQVKVYNGTTSGILYRNNWQRCLPTAFISKSTYMEHINAVGGYQVYIDPSSQQTVINSPNGQMSSRVFIKNNTDQVQSLYFDDKYDQPNERMVGCIQSCVLQADFANQERGFYWLAELYRDKVANKFGGTSEEALSNNVWYVCGPSVNIENSGAIIHLDCLEGDTFYQRYDHLKTYPYSQDDENQVIEIVSFMCESRVNIDGRYDLMRGLESNNNISSEAFNSINKVYSQLDNYITGSYVKEDDHRAYKFPNTVIWSDQKLNGEYVDRWTQILTTNSLNLDGDKGRLRALKEYAGTLWGFQDRAIAEILFNPNIAIATTDGSPIELASSGKVEGKRYKFNNIGCKNKWSICETPYGLFFNDDLNKNLMVYTGDSPLNVSDKFGMSTWAKNNMNNTIWDYENFDNMTVQYDRKNKDVLYITSDSCLAYSNIIGGFTSFYSYENIPYFINIGDYTLTVRSGNAQTGETTELWMQNSGNYYGQFFGERKPFYTMFIVNDNPTVDKVFNTLEYRADYFNVDGTYNEGKTFSRIVTWNEYQSNGWPSGTLIDSNVQKKFRIWRLEIPRDMNNTLDRMRNPWQYIKIQQDAAWGGKVEIHDFAVHYTE